jgi:hypothetical protein
MSGCEAEEHRTVPSVTNGAVVTLNGAGLLVLPVGGRSQPHFRGGPPPNQTQPPTQARRPTSKMWFPPGADGENEQPRPNPVSNESRSPGLNALAARRPSLEVALRAGAPAAQATKATTHQRKKRSPSHPPTRSLRSLTRQLVGGSRLRGPSLAAETALCRAAAGQVADTQP